jgi:type II secretory pathway component PulF
LGPGQNERIADRLEELAEALEAGLNVDRLLDSGAGGEAQSMVEKILLHAPSLSRLDQHILEAAERAGELPRALRGRAEAQRFQAETKRLLIRQLSYPIFVLLMAAAVLILVSALGFFAGAGTLLTSILVLTALAVLALWLYLRPIPANPESDGALIPGLKELLRDYGELPYLEALHGLYAAGITIVEAHHEATRTCPVAWLRMRLTRASRHLSEGSGLSEALARESAVSTDTQGLISKAEVSGSLEDALARAAVLRRQVLRRKITRTAKTLGFSLKVTAAIAVAMIALSFYGSYFSVLMG